MRWICHECVYREDATPEHARCLDLIWAYHWSDHIEYRGYAVQLLWEDNSPDDVAVVYYKSRYTTMIENAAPWFEHAKHQKTHSDFLPVGGWRFVSDKAYARWPEGVRTRIEEMIPLMRAMK